MITITPEYLESQGLSPTIVERFWDKVLILPYDKGCWLWTGATDHNGYAVIMAKSKRHGNCMTGAHQVSWILHCGPIPQGQFVCHKCDNPLCVRAPDHLFLSDQLGNVRDMISKGRMPRGENRAFAKLTEDDIHEIRDMYESRRLFQWQIAERFAICQQTVSEIVRKEKWGHVTDITLAKGSRPYCTSTQ